MWRRSHRSDHTKSKKCDDGNELSGVIEIWSGGNFRPRGFAREKRIMIENGRSSGTKDVDWSRFGLSAEEKTPGNGEKELSSCNPTSDTAAVGKNNSNVKELFEEDQVNIKTSFCSASAKYISNFMKIN